jgi:hypothetical protein
MGSFLIDVWPQAKKPLLLLALIGGLAGIAYSFLAGPTRIFEPLDKPIILEKEVKDVWFSPDHLLVALSESGSELKVKEWSSDKLGAYSVLGSQAIDRRALLGNTSFVSILLYAFSPDLQMFAWIDQGRLNIAQNEMSHARLGAPRTMELRPVPVSSMVFLDKSLLILIYQDGKLEAWDASRGLRGLAGTWLEGAWPVKVSGFRVVATSFDTGDIGVVTFSGPDIISAKYYRLKFMDGSTMAVSKSGRILVGTASGKIVDVNSTEERLSGYMGTSSRGIASIAFWDNTSFLITDNSSGIYAKIGDSKIERISELPPANKMVVDGDRLIFSTPDDLEAVRLKMTYRILGERTFWFSIFLSLSSLFFDVWPRLVRLTRPQNAGPFIK